MKKIPFWNPAFRSLRIVWAIEMQKRRTCAEIFQCVLRHCRRGSLEMQTADPPSHTNPGPIVNEPTDYLKISRKGATPKDESAVQGFHHIKNSTLL